MHRETRHFKLDFRNRKLHTTFYQRQSKNGDLVSKSSPHHYMSPPPFFTQSKFRKCSVFPYVTMVIFCSPYVFNVQFMPQLTSLKYKSTFRVCHLLIFISSLHNRIRFVFSWTHVSLDITWTLHTFMHAQTISCDLDCDSV